MKRDLSIDGREHRIEVRAEVKPTDYKGIELVRRAPKTTEADVDAALERKRQELTEYRAI